MRPAATLPDAEHHSPLGSIKLILTDSDTKAYLCEQFANWQRQRLG